MRLLLAVALLLMPVGARAQTLDYNVNVFQTFPAYGADVNAHLAAIVGHNFGTVAPAVTFPYMVWVDTSGATPIYRYRNAANSAWITAFEIEAGASDWLGKVTSSNATLTGGTINGMTIGASTPAAGTFTAATADRVTVSSDTSADVLLFDTLVASTHSGTRLSRDGNSFLMQTRTSANGLVSTDMAATVGTSGISEWSFRVNGAERLNIGNGLIDFNPVTTAGTYFQISTTGINTRAVMPETAATHDIGRTSTGTIRRWANIFLTNAPNVSSDARLKTEIGDVAAAECRAADRIEVRRYKKAADPTGPWHFGAIAQEVIAAFEAEGLDWRDYAIVTGSEADTYGVAYDELQNLKLACS